jgi:hypothetical protein
MKDLEANYRYVQTECPLADIPPNERYCQYTKRCESTMRKTGQIALTVHHMYWPHHDYNKGYEKQFRNDPYNQELLCPAVHEELHHEYDPPKKPSRDEMELFINHGSNES